MSKAPLMLYRHAVPLLLISTVVSLAFHISHLQTWLIAFAVVSISWRTVCYIGLTDYPHWFLKMVAVFACGIGVVLTYGKEYSIESASAFLVAATILKLVEMRYRRDAYIVIFISFFVMATGLLFDQTLITSLLAILNILIITSAWIAIHIRPAENSETIKSNVIARNYVHKQSLQLASIVMIISIPFMILCYVVFPRIGPLWAINLQSNSAKTGLSDTISPGDISNLVQSDELAFRVTFLDDNRPLQKDLYWRSLVMDRYDGRQWLASKSENDDVDWSDRSVAATNNKSSVNDAPPIDSLKYQYEIIQEPTGQRNLMALDNVVALSMGIGVTQDDRLISQNDVNSRMRYSAGQIVNALDRTKYESLDANEINRYTRLPNDANPRIREWSLQQFEKSPSPNLFIKQFLETILNEEFQYTLRPPRLGANDIDQFFFDFRRGFCAHYASALTFALRSVGIPARLIAGYQGGEWNNDEYLIVRQYDAHAWVEYWNDGYGWITIDPTAVIAPDRIEMGLEEAVREEGSFLENTGIIPINMSRSGWINQMRLQFDAINYYWQNWVLGYDSNQQQQLFGRLFKEYSLTLLGYLLAGALAFMMLTGGVVLWWLTKESRVDKYRRQWHELIRLCEERGFFPDDIQLNSVTPSQCFSLIESQFPNLKNECDHASAEWKNIIYQEQYGRDKMKPLELSMNRLIRAIRKVKY